MNLKKKLASLFPSKNRSPLVRIDGSLSGNAFFEEGDLRHLKEVVEAITSQRSYSFDLDLSGGRFSIFLVDAVIPLSSFVADPEADIAQDLQNMIEALPPPERSRLSCTFRALWHCGGEITGVAFQVAPPGRVATERRIRSEEEYDRLAEQQALAGFAPSSSFQLPKWAMIAIGIAAVVIVYLLSYQMSPEIRIAELCLHLNEKIDLNGFETLIKIGEAEVDVEGVVRFTVYPLEGCEKALAATLEPHGEEDVSNRIQSRQARLAREALTKGRLYMEFFDEKQVLVDRVPLDFSGFDGMTPIRVHARIPLLLLPPSKVRISP